MKILLIPVITIVLFLNSGIHVHAQGPSNPVQDILDAVTNRDSREKNNNEKRENDNKKDEQEDDSDNENTVSPSPSPTQASDQSPTPSPSPGIITIPPITIPIIGGRDDRPSQSENNRKSEEEVQATPTPTIPPESVQTPRSVQSSQRRLIERPQPDQDEDESPVAAITKPIEPPLDLVRGAVKGEFYTEGGLSQKSTIFSIAASFVFLAIGMLLLKGEMATFFVRRGRSLPLPNKEPFTIPYIGKMYR